MVLVSDADTVFVEVWLSDGAELAVAHVEGGGEALLPAESVAPALPAKLSDARAVPVPHALPRAESDGDSEEEGESGGEGEGEGEALAPPVAALASHDFAAEGERVARAGVPLGAPGAVAVGDARALAVPAAGGPPGERDSDGEPLSDALPCALGGALPEGRAPLALLLGVDVVLREGGAGEPLPLPLPPPLLREGEPLPQALREPTRAPLAVPEPAPLRVGGGVVGAAVEEARPRDAVALPVPPPRARAPVLPEVLAVAEGGWGEGETVAVPAGEPVAAPLAAGDGEGEPLPLRAREG